MIQFLETIAEIGFAMIMMFGAVYAVFRSAQWLRKRGHGNVLDRIANSMITGQTRFNALVIMLLSARRNHHQSSKQR